MREVGVGRLPARRLVILSIVLLLGAFAVLGRQLQRASATCAGCNVVLVSIDTLRADHLGAYHYPRPTSPNIDRLASKSVIFGNAISQSAWTRPAHASMFTGLYPAQHGMLSVRDRRRIPRGAVTLAEVLAGEGYSTAAFTGGGNVSGHFGFDRGFQEFHDDGRRLENHLAGIRAWLDAAPREPFFLFVHGYDPHKPYRSRAVDRAALGLPIRSYRDAAAPCQHGTGDIGPLVGEYDAAIHRADRSIGALLRMLHDRQLMDRTIIVVTSDHGEEFLEHGGCFHVRTLYREVVHVPLIVAVPGNEPRRVSEVVPASVAVASTLLDLVGLEPGRLPGPSLASAIRGEPPSRQFVVSETVGKKRDSQPRSGHVRALTGNDEKLIWWLTSGRTEYFDLRSDPNERQPVAAAASTDHLMHELASWTQRHRPGHAWQRAKPLPVKLRERLRSLGYVN